MPNDTAPSVLLVDDDTTFRRAMAKALGRKGFAVAEAATGEEAIPLLQDPDCPHGVVVLDLQMPGTSGLEVLRRTPRRRPRIVVLTGHGTIPDAVEAMRLGAFSFLQKPIDADELVPVLQQALAPQQADVELLVGESQATVHLRTLLASLADVDDPVLICGETGTGKEVVARFLHQRSARAAHPFVAINLACLPGELLESELFGHARGAFTGADRRKPGLFAEAGEGTLFLDEIGELPLQHQPKLLRVLETRTFRPVGEAREEPLRARLVVATNRDLRQMVQRGEFREDLYYRLAVLPIMLPPLRSRPEDIVPIAEHWLRRLAPQGPWLGEAARQALLSHDYPGNVRELVNVVRRIALFARGGEVDGELVRRMLAEDPFRTLRRDATPPRQAPAPSPEPLTLRELEVRHIEQLLRQHRNITMVARLLDIDRRTLQRKLRGLGIVWRDG
ncbi:MAG: sigma-54 dependent transcriptional regulator [Myxococcales bacterium]|nr:sigma-54 dependent transcriptional regulator [Myxococcota bacterium]MDW8282292.1 sigma-54 dependent transcriptional regulator [Myxococcales bacterium]